VKVDLSHDKVGHIEECRNSLKWKAIRENVGMVNAIQCEWHEQLLTQLEHFHLSTLLHQLQKALASLCCPLSLVLLAS
jgi:hypothetical protein